MALVSSASNQQSEIFTCREIKYAGDTEDVLGNLMPKLRIEMLRLNISLNASTDGADFCKIPVDLACPTFFRIVNLPLNHRLAMKKWLLGARYAATVYPRFDVVCGHMKKELQVIEEIDFKGATGLVTFEPILFVADPAAKSKVLKMRQINGCYGCTRCTQKENYVGGVNRHTHDEDYVMRSFSSHLLNVP